ncbi:MAG: ATP-grasp domain-containing protein, partial [Deltaproteobacteria bacterium]
DGENRSSLSVTRSLGKKGYRVIVCGKEFRNISSVSRYCHKGYKVGDPNRNDNSYFNRVLEIILKENIEMVFPMSDSTICILNKNRNNVPQNAIIACPDDDKVEPIVNKYSLFRIAEANGILIPKTVFFGNRQEYFSKEPELPEFPLVIKPFKSRIPTANGSIPARVMYANHLKELNTLIKRGDTFDYPFLIQERILGPGTGLFTLFDKNKHIALFSHKRLREKPPSGGVSVLCESVSLDEEMVEASKTLLSIVEWTGVAMVEFKRDRRDGKVKLMEINGRFWGSLQLAIESGIDFPCLLIDYLGHKVPEQIIDKYRVGVRLKWILGTLDHLLIRLKNKNERLNLPEDSPSRTRAVVEFLKIKEKNTKFDVFDFHDLSPFLLECRDYLSDIIVSS